MHVSPARRAPAAEGADAVGRRAADAGARPGAHGRARGFCCSMSLASGLRRSWCGRSCVSSRRCVSLACQFCRRAECARRAGDGRLRLCARDGRDRPSRPGRRARARPARGRDLSRRFGLMAVPARRRRCAGGAGDSAIRALFREARTGFSAALWPSCSRRQRFRRRASTALRSPASRLRLILPSA